MITNKNHFNVQLTTYLGCVNYIRYWKEFSQSSLILNKKQRGEGDYAGCKENSWNVDAILLDSEDV